MDLRLGYRPCPSDRVFCLTYQKAFRDNVGNLRIIKKAHQNALLVEGAALDKTTAYLGVPVTNRAFKSQHL